LDNRFKPFRWFGKAEAAAVQRVMKRGILSGYNAGERQGGLEVEALEDEWCKRFDSDFAIAMNSATSCLLAACVSLAGATTRPLCTSAWSMRAAADAIRYTHGEPQFVDIHPETYCAEKTDVEVSLFGHEPRHDAFNEALIADNAQAPMAGRRRLISIYSLNRHKHIQCGEGGVAITNDRNIAADLRAFRNHGPIGRFPGLNLRMTELCAAVARVQLSRMEELVGRTRKIGKALRDEFYSHKTLIAPPLFTDCEHDFYFWTARVKGGRREALSAALKKRGVPHVLGYVEPLASETVAPEAWKAHREVICFECCAWDAKPEQVAEGFHKAARESL